MATYDVDFGVTLSETLAGTETIQGFTATGGTETTAYGAGGGTVSDTGTDNGNGGKTQTVSDANLDIGTAKNVSFVLNDASLTIDKATNTNSVDFGTGESEVNLGSNILSSLTFDGISFTNFGVGDIINLGIVEPLDLSYTGGVLSFTLGLSDISVDIGLAAGTLGFTVGGNITSGFYIEGSATCYCRGTNILTNAGEVAIEELKIGDQLITKSGAARAIRWIGRSCYARRFAVNNGNLRPVLIRAGALADHVPSRDLYVSPAHAMYLDGVLIPAAALVNGSSILQLPAAEVVEYFHVELESHDIIIANGALSESFVDDDSRDMFHNAAEFSALYPESIRAPAQFCAPVVEDGEQLEAVRTRIAARIPETLRRAA